AGRAGGGKRLRQKISREPGSAALARRGGHAAQGLDRGACALRRRIRGALRGHARVGGARVPPCDHGLGARPLLRNHLTNRRNTSVSEIKCISPVDGREVAVRRTATPAEIDAALENARAAQRAWVEVPLTERVAAALRFLDA